ncbi:MAG: hypothetical protein A2Y17_10425 [Clostridiales bacterium GWF2_38_85]|nr:MAG: hypothetical protein A2Y17_10425 [Clostridiales bacterium GWF2_38_85]
MNAYIEIVAAAFATLFFALMRRTPNRVLLLTTILGASGWALFSIIEGYNEMAAYFAAALFIGILAEIFARIKKTPTTVILICGIIPLVPGVLFYETMMYFVQDDTNQAIQSGVDTLLSAGSMVFAIIVSTLLGKHIINPITKFIRSKKVKKA